MLKKIFEKLLISLGGKVSYRRRVNANREFLKKYKKIELLGCRFSFSYPPRMGENNKVLLTKNGEVVKELKEQETIPGFNIQIFGDNNIIKFDINTIFRGCCAQIRGNNNKIIIEYSPHVIHGVYVQMTKYGNNRIAHIKKNLFCWSATLGYGTDNNSSIVIGNDCVFSSGITIRCSDGHPIYDLNSKKRINLDKNVNIGDKVWIAQDVKILKGVTIPSNCIIGANAFVVKSQEKENSVIVGNPAKIVKNNVYWERLYPIETQFETFDIKHQRERERGLGF